MAQGDVTVFDEAKLEMLEGGWANSDTIKCAVLDNTTTPTAADATPSLADYTEVGTAGTYTAGGTTLGVWSSTAGTGMLSEAAGKVTFDSTTNPTWAQDASNDTDAYWGLIYNDTQADNYGIAFVDLGGPVDMTAGDLTITWGSSGIFTAS